MNLTCPHCYTQFPAESGTEDNSARQLFGKLQIRPDLAGVLIPYLSLFKPRIQSLRWSRALALAEQVLEIEYPDPVIHRALIETVEALKAKRQSESWKPLTNHNYLISVCSSVNASLTSSNTTALSVERVRPTPTSSTSQALIDLEKMKND